MFCFRGAQPLCPLLTVEEPSSQNTLFGLEIDAATVGSSSVFLHQKMLSALHPFKFASCHPISYHPISNPPIVPISSCFVPTSPGTSHHLLVTAILGKTRSSWHSVRRSSRSSSGMEEIPRTTGHWEAERFFDSSYCTPFFSRACHISPYFDGNPVDLLGSRFPRWKWKGIAGLSRGLSPGWAFL